MAKLLVIVGLPGSGKSYFIKTVKGSYSGIVAEDFHAGSFNNSPKVTDSKYYPPLIAALKAGKDSIIADIEFCDTWRRIEIGQVIKTDVKNVNISWHFFENNPEMCEQNARKRNRVHLQEEIRKIEFLSQKYFIPEGCEQHQVYNGTTTHT